MAKVLKAKMFVCSYTDKLWQYLRKEIIFLEPVEKVFTINLPTKICGRTTEIKKTSKKFTIKL